VSKSLALIALLSLLPRPQQPEPRPGVLLKEEALTLEYTVGADEAVLRLEAESEQELEQVCVRRPDGQALLNLSAPRPGRTEGRGLSSFEVEWLEGSLSELLASYPEGTYRIEGRTVGGAQAQGSAVLSLALPPAPRPLHPSPGAIVSTHGLTVRWLPDRGPVSYRVVLEQDENDGLTIQLPAGSDSFRVPEGFLAPNRPTQLEIAAIGASGNRTLVEVPFTTR